MGDKKEDILDRDIAEQWCEGDTVPKCRGWILESMDEYAKQQAESFGKFIFSQCKLIEYTSEYVGDKYWLFNGYRFSEEQLYEIFLDHQNKQP